MSYDTTGAAPAGQPSEPGTADAAQNPAATTDPATGSGEGGDEGQVTPKTYSEQEHRDAIERATAKAAAKAERRAYREALAQLGGQQQQPQAPTKQQADEGKPLRAQFATEDQWLDARDAWRDKQRETQQSRNQHEQSEKAMVDKVRGIYAKAEKLAGFDPEAFGELPCTDAMTDAIVDGEAPERMMLYLQQNPAEAARISKLPPYRQAAEIGKLETKVAAAPPRTSQAPDPISPIGSGKTPVTSLDTNDMDAYMAQRRKQGATWAR